MPYEVKICLAEKSLGFVKNLQTRKEVKFVDFKPNELPLFYFNNILVKSKLNVSHLAIFWERRVCVKNFEFVVFGGSLNMTWKHNYDRMIYYFFVPLNSSITCQIKHSFTGISMWTVAWTSAGPWTSGWRWTATSFRWTGRVETVGGEYAARQEGGKLEQGHDMQHWSLWTNQAGHSVSSLGEDRTIRQAGSTWKSHTHTQGQENWWCWGVTSRVKTGGSFSSNVVRLNCRDPRQLNLIYSWPGELRLKQKQH